MSGQNTRSELDRAYAQGIDCFQDARYAQAIEILLPLSSGRKMIARIARFYLGRSHRQLGLEAMRSSRFDVAENHFLKAMDYLGRCCDLSSFLAGSLPSVARCSESAWRAQTGEPSQARIARRLAQSQWNSGRREQAYLTLHEAIRHGAAAELHLQLGLFLAAEERIQEASASLEKAVEIDCANPDGYRYLGLIRAARGEAAEAARLFQRAFELRSGDLMLAYQMALAARSAAAAGCHLVLRPAEPSLEHGDDSQIQQLARYVSHEPDFLEALLVLPPSAADALLFQTLLNVTKAAMAQNPAYADLHLYCSRIYQRLGRETEAIREAFQAVHCNPNYKQALAHLAKMEARQGQDESAIEHLHQAFASGADWPDLHCLAGEILTKFRRNEQARIHLRRALELNANYDRAAQALAALAA